MLFVNNAQKPKKISNQRDAQSAFESDDGVAGIERNVLGQSIVAGRLRLQRNR